MPIAPDRYVPAPDKGVAALVHRAIEDGRDLAQAEVALVKAKVGERASAWNSAAIFFGIAAVLALAAIIALLVGLIMTIATLVGPGWATLIVIGTTLVIAAVLGIVGRGKLTPLKVST